MDTHNLFLLREERGADGVHGRVAPALVVESALLVEVLEELHVGLAPPEVQVANLEVGPDWERRERREVSM